MSWSATCPLCQTRVGTEPLRGILADPVAREVSAFIVFLCTPCWEPLQLEGKRRLAALTAEQAPWDIG